MATASKHNNLTDQHQKEACRAEWLERLNDLVSSVETWAKEYGWATRRIEKTMKDSILGEYKAPALRIQEDFAQILLEPIARFTPGSEGVVDLYLMPSYDDVASIYFRDGTWNLHYMFTGTASVATLKDANPQAFDKEALHKVVSEMVAYAAQN
jgi:hypothetical protein